MSEAWFVFAVVGSLVLLGVVVVVAAMLRAAWIHKETEALTASDLRAVEESAMMLIDQLKTEADRSISEIDARCDKLRELLEETDRRIAELQTLAASAPAPVQNELPGILPEIPEPDGNADTAHILQLASEGLDCVEIARATGMDCADVKVAIKLGALAAERENP